MSLHSQAVSPIRDLAAEVARHDFRRGKVYVQIRDVLGMFFADVMTS